MGLKEKRRMVKWTELMKKKIAFHRKVSKAQTNTKAQKAKKAEPMASMRRR